MQSHEILVKHVLNTIPNHFSLNYKISEKYLLKLSINNISKHA